ncbi:MAG: MoxR family ATPase [Chloroflexi bacterium]|nr:MoxR family ATPase [Chloroflexota bacterium]
MVAVSSWEHQLKTVQAIEREISKVIVGQKEIVRGVLISLMARNHSLLEGVPGLGKTLLVRVLAEALELQYSRVQFTPDLMPADIIGTNVIVEDGQGEKYFRFEYGPIFANIILADEINRATPKTQSALLEAMQEQTVTVGKTVHTLPRPFFVLATQNPMEMEGTYPLPEAQLDRFFFKLLVRYPSNQDLTEILLRTTGGASPKVNKVADGQVLNQISEMAREVPIASHVLNYAVRLVTATHPDRPDALKITRDYVRYGSSPRGGQALVLAGKIRALLEGRYNVSFEDIREVAHPALRHRIILNFQGEMEALTTDQMIDELLRVVPSE